MARVKRGGAKIKILGLDPAFAAFGVVEAELNLDTFDIRVVDMHLIKTEKQAGKGYRVSSDNLRRAREINNALGQFYPDAYLIFSEIPQGSQSAKACTALGIAVGIVASGPLPIIEVTAFEVKKEAVGKKTASKGEMIDWATKLYPNAPWKTKKQKGVISFTNDNEHLADAIGVIHAGVKTDQFQQVLNMLKTLKK
jgi:Holliday junction resolvasome RuvABC endonuclease subunit